MYHRTETVKKLIKDDFKGKEAGKSVLVSASDIVDVANNYTDTANKIEFVYEDDLDKLNGKLMVSGNLVRVSNGYTVARIARNVKVYTSSRYVEILADTWKPIMGQAEVKFQGVELYRDILPNERFSSWIWIGQCVIESLIMSSNINEYGVLSSVKARIVNMSNIIVNECNRMFERSVIGSVSIRGCKVIGHGLKAMFRECSIDNLTIEDCVIMDRDTNLSNGSTVKNDSHYMFNDSKFKNIRLKNCELYGTDYDWMLVGISCDTLIIDNCKFVGTISDEKGSIDNKYSEQDLSCGVGTVGRVEVRDTEFSRDGLFEALMLKCGISNVIVDRR